MTSAPDPLPRWRRRLRSLRRRFYQGLARSARAKGRTLKAASYSLRAYEQTPQSFSALLDFLEDLPCQEGRAALLERADRTRPLLSLDTSQGSATAADLMLDVTELMLWYRSFRLPSGVQRVQTGLVRSLLGDPDADVAVCRFDGASWKIADSETFLRLLDLSQVGDDRDDPAWQDTLIKVHLSLTRSPPARFGKSTVLISIGAWVTHAYLDALDVVKRDSGAKYIPLIYDLIPILRPDWFPPNVGEGFPLWFERLQSTADAYVTISDATKQDLIRLSAGPRGPVDTDRVTVMALDADFRNQAAHDAEGARVALRKFGLSPRQYVLFVSTIEPRKNHAGALEAWQVLIKARGLDAVPPLVCVGGRGWNNDNVHRLLADDRSLQSRVKLLSGVSDGDLHALYANARFTLYPSLYEGWGLPVTESLCHGRAAVVASNSALTEAGGDLVDYFDAEDVDELVTVVSRLIDDDAYLAGRERRIAERFAPREWRQLGGDLERAADGARAGR